MLNAVGKYAEMCGGSVLMQGRVKSTWAGKVE